MKVSIVIPVYNVRDYLRQCVGSVQKLAGEIEVLLVDDGSTDDSGAICDELAAEDCRIRVIHRKNGGLSEARNTGLRNCSGDYVLFLDSDDFLDPAETEKLLLCCSSGTDVVMGLYRNYYTDKDCYEPENSPAFLKMNGKVSAEQFLNTIPTDGQTCYMTAWRFIVRREFLLEHALFFFPGIYHEDEEWTQRMLCCANTLYITHCYFYQYRQARIGAITSSVKPKHVFDTLLIMERTSELLTRFAPECAKGRYLCHKRANLYLNNVMNLHVLEDAQRTQVMEQLRGYRKECVPFLTGRIGSLVGCCDRLFGFSFACWVVRVLQTVRNHRYQ